MQANGGGGGSGFAQGRLIDATVAYTGARRHPGHVGGTGQPAVAVELSASVNHWASCRPNQFGSSFVIG